MLRAEACAAGWGGLRIAGRRVLVLGAGTAAEGLACAALGASSVLATDVDEAALELAARNARLNGLDATFSTARLDLAAPAELAPPSPPPDVVLASDLVYDFLPTGALCGSIARLLAHDPAARALCVHDRAEHRTSAAMRAVDGFLDAAAAAGLRCVASEARAADGGELLMQLFAVGAEDAA